jgi:hypothetical protein
MAQLTTVKLNRDLCDRARLAAEAAGYSSLEELIEHAIEQHLAGNSASKDTESPKEMIRQLKGLGYIE